VSVSIPLLPAVDLPALLKAVQAGVDQLASNSRRVEQQQQSWLLSTQRVQHWQLRRLTGGKADAGGPHLSSSNSSSSSSSSSQGVSKYESSTQNGVATMQQLSVQVVVPLQGSSPHEASSSSSSSSGGGRRGSSDGGSSDTGSAGHVLVAKAASFTGDELELLGKLVAAANKPGSGQVRVICTQCVLLAVRVGACCG
jgi:hypothetical protein